MIFYCISELILAIFSFLSQFKSEIKFYRLSGATFPDCVNTIYQLINPFLDNKMSTFEEYGAFNPCPVEPGYTLPLQTV